MKQSEISRRKNMLAKDLFEIDKVQIFDKKTGNYICTMSLIDSTGDLRSIADYTPVTETKEEEYTNPNQTSLF